jgi:hypothetical protein
VEEIPGKTRAHAGEGIGLVKAASLVKEETMGMLFSTGPTLEILNMLNQHFGTTNINNIRGSKNNYLGWPLGNGTFAFASGLGLVPSSHPGNWNKWLDLLDKHHNKKNSANPAEICATTVGNAINDALNNNNCTAIEFYAIPDNSGDNHISVEAFNFSDGKNKITKVINVYTLTHDKLAKTVSAQRVYKTRSRTRGAKAK